MAAHRILLIEVDPRLAEMLVEYLGKAGFHVVRAETGARGLALHASETVDAIVLDLMLPDMDGLDICRKVRDRSDTPILMLTARRCDRPRGRARDGRRRLSAETVRAARAPGPAARH